MAVSVAVQLGKGADALWFVDASLSVFQFGKQCIAIGVELLEGPLVAGLDGLTVRRFARVFQTGRGQFGNR